VVTTAARSSLLFLSLERFHKSRPRGGQGFVVRPEDVTLEEKTRQIEALPQLLCIGRQAAGG
jgi:hypothetical protein